MRAYPLIHEEGVIGACPRFWRRTKGWSLRPAARLLVASISAVLSGCPSAHHDASGALCGPTTAMPGWIGNSYLADSEGESLSYSIGAQEPVSTIPQTAPGGEKMYWIILGGRVETGDRSKPQQFAINSKPLIYWPTARGSKSTASPWRLQRWPCSMSVTIMRTASPRLTGAPLFQANRLISTSPEANSASRLSRQASSLRPLGFPRRKRAHRRRGRPDSTKGVLRKTGVG